MATATQSALQTRMYIDGQWCDAADGRTYEVVNPATEEVIAAVAYGNRGDAKRAVEAAHRAMQSWMRLTAYDRAKVLKKTADLIERDLRDLIELLTAENGKTIRQCRAEMVTTQRLPGVSGPAGRASTSGPQSSAMRASPSSAASTRPGRRLFSPTKPATKALAGRS